MEQTSFKIFRHFKKYVLCTLLIAFLGNTTISQELEFMDLGVIEGEFKRFKRTITWVNQGEEAVKLKLWADNPDLKFELTEEDVPSGGEIEIPVSIILPNKAGDYDYELRLLDANDFVLYGYQLSFKVLQSELDVFKAYRNVYWPFRTKEEVFSLKAGRQGDTLTAVFDIYNLGGSHLTDLDEVVVSDSVGITFSSNEIKHNQFGQMEVRFITNTTSDLGFHKTIVKLYQDRRLLAAIPIQYTLLPTNGTATTGAKLATSIVNYDFKAMKVGQSKNVVVSVANNGTQPLTINKMESNCDCLMFNKIESIAPGTSKRLNVTFDATGRLGLERKTIAIFSNDPKNPVRVLTFRAHVK